MNRTQMIIVLAAVIATVAGCKGKPSGTDVCKRIEATGVGANCREGKPGGLGAAAVERVEFDLPSVPGEGGSVMRFDRESFYESTEEAYGKAAMLAGPHRYGSKKALIFVQMNQGLSMDEGRKVKAVVDGL